MAHCIEISAKSEKHYKCGTINVGDATFYYSYSAIIALSRNGYRIRRHNQWGPTTGRHMHYLYCHGFKTMSDEGFEAMKNQILKESLQNV